MKLRFVKFLTSRENEIEKKEEGGRRSNISCPSATQLGRGQSPRSRPHFCFLFLSSFLLYSPLHPAPPTRNLPAQLVCRHVPEEQYSPAIPSPAVPPLPSFFINYRSNRAWREGPWRSAQLADPAVLPNDNMRAPSSPHPCPFIQSDAAASLRFQWHPLCGGWSHRKTKYENELSCFITFIDE